MRKPSVHIEKLRGGMYKCTIHGTILRGHYYWMREVYITATGKTQGEAINKAAANFEREYHFL